MINHLNHDATDRLSRCASALMCLAEALAFHHWEASAYHAPSECVADTNRGHARDAIAALDAHGFTVDSFEAAFAARVSGRAAFELLGEMCLPEGDDDGEGCGRVRDLMIGCGFGNPDRVDTVIDSWRTGVLAVRATFRDGRTEEFVFHPDAGDGFGPELETVEFGAWPPRVSR